VERAAEECGQRRCEARIGSGGKVMMQRVLASRHFEDKLHPILRKLKLIQPGMGMHAFRRGRISHLVYSGVSRQVIRDWCGHSSDKMIDHYTKMLRQHHAPEMAKVKPLLGRSWTLVGPQLVEGRVL